jgi:soluble lytic murein transglycosylase-like protein
MIKMCQNLAQLRRQPSGSRARSCLRGVPAAKSSRARMAAVAGTLFLAAGALYPMTSPSIAEAQVLEIGDDGGVTTYDRPTVFTADGATPIVPRPPPSLGGGRVAVVGAADAGLIGQAAAGEALSPALVEAVAWRESRMRSDVISTAGAIGQMQLLPSTARWLRVDPRDASQNYHGGAAFLRLMLNRYDGDLMRALAAYNAGPAAVDRYHGVPPYRETQAYVAAIMDRLSRQAAALNNKGHAR